MPQLQERGERNRRAGSQPQYWQQYFSALPPPRRSNSFTALQRQESYAVYHDSNRLDATLLPARRRPESTKIARTPLEKLPDRFLVEAERLLACPADVEKWIAGEEVQQALYQQGVSPDEILHTATRSKDCGVCPVELRYAKQLFAQVAWQAEVLMDDLVERRAAAIEKAEHADIGNSSPRALSPMQERREASRQRAGRMQEMRDTALKRWWNERERALDEKLEAARNRRIEQVSKRSRQRNRQRELQLMAFAKEQQLREERKRAEHLRAEQARSDAELRRQQNLMEKSAGPPHLRAARELARLQALRLERIREVQADTAAQRVMTTSATTCALLTGCPQSLGHNGLMWPSSVPSTRPSTRPASASAAVRSGRGKRPLSAMANSRDQTCRSISLSGDDVELRPTVDSIIGVTMEATPEFQDDALLDVRSCSFPGAPVQQIVCVGRYLQGLFQRILEKPRLRDGTSHAPWMSRSSPGLEHHVFEREGLPQGLELAQDGRAAFCASGDDGLGGNIYLRTSFTEGCHRIRFRVDSVVDVGIAVGFCSGKERDRLFGVPAGSWGCTACDGSYMASEGDKSTKWHAATSRWDFEGAEMELIVDVDGGSAVVRPRVLNVAEARVETWQGLKISAPIYVGFHLKPGCCIFLLGPDE